jgi:hypothetical protein
LSDTDADERNPFASGKVPAIERSASQNLKSRGRDYWPQYSNHVCATGLGASDHVEDVDSNLISRSSR